MKTIILVLSVFVGGSAFAKKKVSHPAYGVCYSSRFCEGARSNQPVTLNQCFTMVEESYRQNRDERYGSWKASRGSEACNTSVIDAKGRAQYDEQLELEREYKSGKAKLYGHSHGYDRQRTDKDYGYPIYTFPKSSYNP